MSDKPRDGEAKRADGHIGHRRQDCWWEPIYNPALKLDPTPYDWELSRDSGPTSRFIPGSSLDRCVVPGDTFKVQDITFKDCDFQGQFHPSSLMMFDRCRFVGCDSAYSMWRGAHFRSCTFSDTSFSLAAFEGCEFQGCSWERIGLGSKTEIMRTFVSNPASLIAATVSNTNPRDTTLRHRMYQWFRLRGTRAHVLRTIMISHESIGDEHTYYETVRLHELQRATARMAQDAYGILFSPNGKRIFDAVRIIFHAMDYAILRGFGWLNKWGGSVNRPCLALSICYVGFGFIYRLGRFSDPVAHPFQKSFDITFLIGYTNQANSGVYSDTALTAIQDIHRCCQSNANSSPHDAVRSLRAAA